MTFPLERGFSKKDSSCYGRYFGESDSLLGNSRHFLFSGCSRSRGGRCYCLCDKLILCPKSIRGREVVHPLRGYLQYVSGIFHVFEDEKNTIRGLNCVDFLFFSAFSVSVYDISLLESEHLVQGLTYKTSLISERPSQILNQNLIRMTRVDINRYLKYISKKVKARTQVVYLGSSHNMRVVQSLCSSKGFAL